ncbi:MAG: hypothetical protein E5V25_24530 [Mesorhizobium sp.]|nr:MAG: hypothetical protein E5V25_24530 [Mesorhizobium sp.]
MRAVDRTTQLFLASVKDALPALRTQVSKSSNFAGRSNYVFIFTSRCTYKVRISDHAIGMRRAMRGEEDLYIFAGSKPASWAVWLGELVRRLA